AASGIPAVRRPVRVLLRRLSRASGSLVRHPALAAVATGVCLMRAAHANRVHQTSEMPASDVQVERTGCVVCGAADCTVEARGKDYPHHTSDQEYQYCRCLSCGHFYLNPRPIITGIGRIYPAEYATYTKRFAGTGSLLARIKDKVLLGRFDALA